MSGGVGARSRPPHSGMVWCRCLTPSMIIVVVIFHGPSTIGTNARSGCLLIITRLFIVHVLIVLGAGERQRKTEGGSEETEEVSFVCMCARHPLPSVP